MAIGMSRVHVDEGVLERMRDRAHELGYFDEPARHTREDAPQMCIDGVVREADADPNGIPQHAPGAKLDAGKVRMHLVLSGFGNALEAVGRIGTYGADKYTDNGWMSVPNGKERYADALLRHLLAQGKTGGCEADEESGLPHLAHMAWNALALLELHLRETGK